MLVTSFNDLAQSLASGRMTSTRIDFPFVERIDVSDLERLFKSFPIGSVVFLNKPDFNYFITTERLSKSFTPNLSYEMLLAGFQGTFFGLKVFIAPDAATNDIRFTNSFYACPSE